MWRRYKNEILIFCIALGVRLLYAITIQIFYGSNGFSAYSDAETFLRVADNILTHGIMSQSVAAPFIPDSLRTPLYPYFLAFFTGLKIPLFWIISIQSVLAGVVAATIYRLGNVIFHSPAIGFVAGGFLGFWARFPFLDRRL